MKYKTRYLQSHFDLAVQLYGDFSQIGQVLRNIDDINGNIPLGQVITLDEQTDPTAKYFANRIVATDFIYTAPVTPGEGNITWDRTDITWDRTDITWDQL